MTKIRSFRISPASGILITRPGMIRWFSFLLLLTTTTVVADPPVIVIDPGHGGTATAGTLETRSNSSPNNAVSPGGLREKDLTLEFSLILHDAILEAARKKQKIVGVLLTRKDDTNLDFIQRAAICNRPDTACVVSIHFNASRGGKASGSLAMISDRKRNRNYETDERFACALASACHAGVRQFLPDSKDRGVITDGHLHGGLGSNFFFQMARHRNLAAVPKCFLEVEFIDNPQVEKALLSGDRRARFANVAEPIAAFLVEYAASDASPSSMSIDRE